MSGAAVTWLRVQQRQLTMFAHAAPKHKVRPARGHGHAPPAPAPPASTRGWWIALSQTHCPLCRRRVSPAPSQATPARARAVDASALAGALEAPPAGSRTRATERVPCGCAPASTRTCTCMGVADVRVCVRGGGGVELDVATIAPHAQRHQTPCSCAWESPGPAAVPAPHNRTSPAGGGPVPQAQPPRSWALKRAPVVLWPTDGTHASVSQPTANSAAATACLPGRVPPLGGAPPDLSAPPPPLLPPPPRAGWHRLVG